MAKYGAQAINEGKITQAQLDQIKRVEGASANSLEHFPLFASAMIWAHVAGLVKPKWKTAAGRLTWLNRVPATVINGSGLAYTIACLCYSFVYIFVDAPTLSQLRGICWWISNMVCLRLFWLGGNAINA